MNMLFTTFSTREKEPILIFLILMSKADQNTDALCVTGETKQDIQTGKNLKSLQIKLDKFLF